MSLVCMDQDEVEECARIVHQQFTRCKFKLQPDQWIIVAGIIQDDGASKKIVALGAGLKCLPLAEYNSPGLCPALLHDSHAEILARRSFIRYCLHQFESNKEDSILQKKDFGKWRLKEGIKFHLYVSQAPCGDASMSALLQANEEEICESTSKRQRVSPDDDNSIRRGRSDFSAPLGTLRTKPGRADAPLATCMSCSDKIAMWTLLGCQGSRMMNLLEAPIYLDSILIGDGYDKEALERALNSRISFEMEQDSTFRVHRLNIYHVQKSPFEYRQEQDKIGSFEGMLWYPGIAKPEVTVKGRKIGSLAPKAGSLPVSSMSSVCRSRINGLIDSIAPGTPSHSDEYERIKSKLLSTPLFKAWIRSPRL